MNRVLIIMLVLLLATLVGCQRESEYELSIHASQLYRLDKRSGEISIIEGSKIIPLEEPTTDVAKEAITILRTTKTWNEISLPQLDTLNLNLRTRWREGQLHFIFTATPFNKKLRDAQESYPSLRHFNLKLLDSDGFVIHERQITISEMTRVVDESGKPTGMQINSRISCSAETYLSIEDWSCGWRL